MGRSARNCYSRCSTSSGSIIKPPTGVVVRALRAEGVLMSQNDAWRYRPLVSELRSGRGNLRRRWSLAQRNDERDAARRRPVQDRLDRGERAWEWLDRATDRWGWKLYGTGLGLAHNALWASDESDVRRSGSPNDGWTDWGGRGHQPFSGGSYDSNAVPWRPGGLARWDRGPKTAPWPADADGATGGGQGTNKHPWGTTVRYERS